LIVQIRTALDRAVDFNKRVTVFTTGRACTPSSNIEGGNADIQLRCGPVHNQVRSTILALYKFVCMYACMYVCIINVNVGRRSYPSTEVALV